MRPARLHRSLRRASRWSSAASATGPRSAPLRRTRPPAGLSDEADPEAAPRPEEQDPVEWPELRAAGQHGAADRLAAEVRAGRIGTWTTRGSERAWQAVRAGRNCCRLHRHRAAPGRRRLRAPLRRPRPAGPGGPARPAHRAGTDRPRSPTTAQPLPAPGRRARPRPDAARHRAARRRPARVRQDPAGRCGRSWSPCACRRSPGTAAVVAVGAAGADPVPADAYDVVISLGDPSSAYDLDLYGGSTDPDEAAGHARRGAVADEAAEGGQRRAAHRARPAARPLPRRPRPLPVRGRAARAARRRARPRYAALRDALDAAGAHAHASATSTPAQRQSGRPGDVGPLLADRIALLDRPAFAGFFDVTGRDSAARSPCARWNTRCGSGSTCPSAATPRRRGCWPGSSSRSSPRAVGRRADRSLFACLVLDDAAAHDHGRGRPRPRAAALRQRRGGAHPAHAWTTSPRRCAAPCSARSAAGWPSPGSPPGTATGSPRPGAPTWVETRDVTRTPDQSGGRAPRASHAASASSSPARRSPPSR